MDVFLFQLLLSTPAEVETNQSAPASSEKVDQQAKLVDKQVESLLRANPATRGRDELVAECQVFLREKPENPRRAEIMVRIAHLCSLTDASAGFEAQPERALKWYRIAAENAEIGSETWCAAYFGVSEILRNLASREAQLEDRDRRQELLAESREALEAVAKVSRSPFLQLRAETELVNQYRLEDNPLGMEMQAKRVLDWEPSQDVQELDPRDAQMVRVMKMGAAHNLAELAVHAGSLDAFAPASLAGPKQKRARYLKDLAAKYPTPEVTQPVERALQQLESRAEPQLVGIPRTSQARAEKQRHVWIAINILAVVILGFTIVIRQRALRRQT